MQETIDKPQDPGISKSCTLSEIQVPTKLPKTEGAFLKVRTYSCTQAVPHNIYRYPIGNWDALLGVAERGRTSDRPSM